MQVMQEAMQSGNPQSIMFNPEFQASLQEMMQNPEMMAAMQNPEMMAQMQQYMMGGGGMGAYGGGAGGGGGGGIHEMMGGYSDMSNTYGGGNSEGKSCVLMCYGLEPPKWNCERLFNLLCQGGNFSVGF